MSEQSVALAGKVELHAVHHAPDAAADLGAGVVFVHGWSGTGAGPHRMFVNAARRFAAEGFHCLRIDLSGRGDSLGDKDRTDLDMMIDDVLAGCAWLREAGVGSVHVLGICSGGNVALGVASLDKSLAGLALWSTPLFAPFKKSTEDLRRRGWFLAAYAGKLFRRETWAKLVAGKLNIRLILAILSGKTGGPRKGAGARNPKDSLRDIMTGLHGYAGRTLFVYGSADDEAAGAPEFYRQYCADHNIPHVFHTVAGANHSYYSLDWEAEVIDTTLGWLRQDPELAQREGKDRVPSPTS